VGHFVGHELDIARSLARAQEDVLAVGEGAGAQRLRGAPRRGRGVNAHRREVDLEAALEPLLDRGLQLLAAGRRPDHVRRVCRKVRRQGSGRDRQAQRRPRGSLRRAQPWRQHARRGAV